MRPLLFILFFTCFTAFSQQKICVVDGATLQPLEHVVFTQSNGELICLTNRFGITILPENQTTVTISRNGYYPVTDPSLEGLDTLKLLPEISDLEEVAVIGMTDRDLLKKIVSKSRKTIGTAPIAGELRYHASHWVIVRDTVNDLVDTVTVNTVCSFNFARSAGKNAPCRFYPIGGSRYLMPHRWKNKQFTETEILRVVGSRFQSFDRIFELAFPPEKRLLVKKNCASTRERDNMSLLHFDCSGQQRNCYYTSDTLLHAYIASFPASSTPCSWFAGYAFFGDRYFLQHASEEFQSEVVLKNVKLKIIALQTLSIVTLNTDQVKEGTAVDPETFIQSIPYTETEIFSPQTPSVK